MKKSNVVWESERLFFRLMEKDDFTIIAKMLKDPSIMYAWQRDFNDDDVNEWIDNRIRNYKTFGFDFYVAIDKISGNAVGQIGLVDEFINNEHKIGVGYILNKEYQNKGYASEGARAMFDYAFKVLKVGEVVATIRPENIASIKVAEGLGMKLIGNFIKVYNKLEMKHYIYSINVCQKGESK